MNVMKVDIPKSKVIIGYEDLFGEYLEDRVSLIKGICKKHLIAEISGLNYRLKPNNRFDADYSFETQDRELLYFSGENRELYEKYGAMAHRFSRSNGDYPLLFTRQSCLFALEEIVNSKIVTQADFKMTNSWENLLKYLFAVNGVIVRFKGESEEKELVQVEGLATDGKTEPLTLEDVSVRTIVLNELNVSSNQLYVFFRGYNLLNFLTNHADIGQLAIDYLQDEFGMTFDRYVFEIMSLYFANNKGGVNNVKSSHLGLPIDTTFIYYPNEDSKKLFETLSKVFPNTGFEKLLSIRKYPFYNAGDSFMLTDNTILLEKSYSQFINDFWFDKVKLTKEDNGNPIFNIKRYRSIIGEFFESYLKSIVEYITANAKHFKVKTFDGLEIQIDGQQHELTDIYVRYNERVFLAEAKSTGIYDKEKYSGELNEFYKEGRERFFDSFGMKQIVRAIALLPDHVVNIDPGFPKKGTIKVFPALIVNEKALQTPLMAQIFNKRFQELMDPVDFENYKIAPLSLIHVGDLENMEEYLHDDPTRLWKILERHASHVHFIPPFYSTLNVLKIRANFKKPEPLYRELIAKHGRQGDGE